MRFHVYESLYFLNRNVQDILVILEGIKKSPGMPQKSFESYKVELEYLRSHATQDVLEVMNDTEIHEMAKLGKQKKAYEDSIRDLDDVYFEVQRREKQRRKQGLPSLIGVLPVNYQPPASAQEEADDDPMISRTFPGIRYQEGIKPPTRNLHGKRSRRNPRPRRRAERAGLGTRRGQQRPARGALGRAKPA
jgi:hypothetical protein